MSEPQNGKYLEIWAAVFFIPARILRKKVSVISAKHDDILYVNIQVQLDLYFSALFEMSASLCITSQPVFVSFPPRACRPICSIVVSLSGAI